MAYTYDDFLKTASKENMLGRFDSADLQITKSHPDYGLSMLRLMKDQDTAATPEARLLAGETINQLRVGYTPVTLTDDGSSAATPETPTSEPSEPVTQQPENTPVVQEPTAGTPTGEATAGGSFTYDQEDAYRKLMAAITNPSAFRYNHESDPNWGAYRKTYLREGERATQDALALASAATGGIPSSYAVTAAQQAGANYADQLAGMIPTLEQNAYNRYLDQQSQKLNALQVLQADRENEYARYLAQQELKAKQEAAAAGSVTGTEPDTGTAGIAEGDLGYLQETYPSGVISSKSTWDWLVAQYGEDALTAAGFRRSSQNEHEYDNEAIIALGLGPISAEEVAQLISDGVVEEYVENGKKKLRLVTPPATGPSMWPVWKP